MAPRKRSLVWTYFKMIDEKTVQCLLCTVCVVHNGPTTTNMMRHLRNKHAAEVGIEGNNAHDNRKSRSRPTGTSEKIENDQDLHIHENLDSVEMDNVETRPIEDEDDITSAITGILEVSEGVAVRKEATKSTADGPSLRTRSLVWKHYKRLENSTSSLCLLCMEEIKHYDRTSNLKRHLSKKHPVDFAGLGIIVKEQPSKTVHEKPAQNNFPKSPTSVLNEGRTELFDVPVSRERRQDEISELERVRELIEAVRNAQKQEAKALEHQRELLEMLRDANARELAAEREKIEALRKAQEKESTALDKQREELRKEKEELQLKWDQLEQNKKEKCTCQLEDGQLK